MDEAGPGSAPELQLTERGPAWRMQRHVGLLGQDRANTGRRILLAVTLTWAPLLIFSSAQGRVAGHAVEVPFLHDWTVYARYLVALPLLIAAEVAIGVILAEGARHFASSGLIRSADLPAFRAAVEQATRLGDSTLAEVLLLGIALTVSVFGVGAVTRHHSSWHTIAPGAHAVITLAGRWQQFVSLPLYLFLLLRWMWRMGLWYLFLFQMNRADLQLNPAHPDHAGGLGFLNEAHMSFSLVVLALGASASGLLADRVELGESPLPVMGREIILTLLLVLLFFVAPLLMFSPRLYRLRRVGLHRYSTLAADYTRLFDEKWLPLAGTRPGHLLGSQDIQALSDLGGGFRLVEETRLTVFNLQLVLAMVLAGVVPLVPVLFADVPVRDMVGFMTRILMG